MRLAYLLACLAAVALLGFVAGSLATVHDTYAGQVMENAYRAGKALHLKLTRYDEPFQADLWRQARTQSAGVTIHRPDRVQAGLTLYTSGHTQAAYLIDMEGRTVHTWSLPFSAVWDRTAAVHRPQPDSHLYIEKALLYPNGDLLAIYVAVGDTPWGYGLVKMDRHSRVIWKYLQHAHHDVDVGPDGRIYVLINEVATDRIAGFPQIRPPRIDDMVAILSPDGQELKRVNLLHAMARSPYARLLSTVPWYTTRDNGDYLHTNTVNVLDGTRAAKLPEAGPGRVLLSFREINAIAILDIDRDEIVWATRGPWLRQHDPDLLANGNILLFDNQGHVGPGGVTRLIEFDPATRQVVWSYAGTAQERFESEVRSSQERLPNGNTLITESDGGRLFEITPAGETVWSYTNPVRGGSEGELIPIVAWAQRIDPDVLTADFRALVLGSEADNASGGTNPRVQAEGRGRAVPIMQSRVTMAASSSSLQPSVAAGRSGTTR